MADLPFGTSPDSNDAFSRTWSTGRGPWAWLRAVNNKPIGTRFLITAFAFFIAGGMQAILMRIQLARPEAAVLSPELYNQLMTMHGSTMMFLFIVPILEGLATLLGPSMLGTRDLPFPRLTAFAYWAYLFGGILMYSSFLFGVAPDGGWFAYVPLTSEEYSPGVNMDFWLLGLELAEAAGIVSAFELIIAVMAMRAPGMTLSRLPVFLWAMLVASAMIMVAFMTVLIASLLLELDRKVGTAFFDPDLGGSPLLWQHLFWFFGHPEVYIQFLPATGIISSLIPVFARRPLASYTAVVFALVATGFLSFGLWAHHMFTTGLEPVTLSFFSAASIVIAVPTGVQFFVWIATLWRGKVVWRTPMLFTFGFLVIFLLGGLSGVMVGVAPFDWLAHDSYFVVAHFHYVLIGGVVFPLMAGFYYWLPKITGRMLSERLGTWNFWIMFVGFNVAFFPMHIVGLLGMPRRVYTYQASVGWGGYNLVSTAGALLFASGVLLFVWNFVRSQRHGAVAGPNPWGGHSLEWATTSPPKPYGFRRLPVVHGRYPLWEQRSLAESDDATREVLDVLARWPTRWQGAIVTDVFTGRIREVFWLPQASYLPVLLAGGLALSLGALIWDLYIPALVGLAIAVVAYVVWMRSRPDDTDHDPEAEATLRRHGIRIYLHSSPTIARWTLVLSMVIALSTLGTLVFSLFYLAVNGPGPWPPDGVEVGGVGLGWIAAALAAASLVPVAWAHRLAGPLLRGRAIALLAVGMMLALAAGAVQVVAYAGLGFGFKDHAFGSIFYLLAAFQLFLLLTALVMSTLAQFRLGTTLDEDLVERVRVSLGNAALAWYVMVGSWLVIFAALYFSSELL